MTTEKRYRPSICIGNAVAEWNTERKRLGLSHENFAFYLLKKLEESQASDSSKSNESLTDQDHQNLVSVLALESTGQENFSIRKESRQYTRVPKEPGKIVQTFNYRKTIPERPEEIPCVDQTPIEALTLRKENQPVTRIPRVNLISDTDTSLKASFERFIEKGRVKNTVSEPTFEFPPFLQPSNEVILPASPVGRSSSEDEDNENETSINGFVVGAQGIPMVIKCELVSDTE